MAGLFNDRGNGGNMTPQTRPQAQPQDTQNQGFNAHPAVASAFRQKMARFGQPQNAPGVPPTRPTEPPPQNPFNTGIVPPRTYQPSIGSGIMPGKGTPSPLGLQNPYEGGVPQQKPIPQPSPYYQEDGIPTPMPQAPGFGPKPSQPYYPEGGFPNPMPQTPIPSGYPEGGLPNPMPQPPNPWGANGGPYGPPQPQPTGPLSDPSIQGNPILGGPGGPAFGGFTPSDPYPNAVKGGGMPLPPMSQVGGAMEARNLQPNPRNASGLFDPSQVEGGASNRYGWQW